MKAEENKDLLELQKQLDLLEKVFVIRGVAPKPRCFV